MPLLIWSFSFLAILDMVDIWTGNHPYPTTILLIIGEILTLFYLTGSFLESDTDTASEHDNTANNEWNNFEFDMPPLPPVEEEQFGQEIH